MARFPLLAVVMIALLNAVAGTTGSITGILKNGAGNPVAGGKLTLLDQAKGTSATARSDRKGSYGFPLVFPGVYKLHAEAQGFEPQDRPDLVIHVNSTVRIDLTLETEKPSR